MTPTFPRQIISAIYHPPFGNVWLSYVCWCTSAKPGNEVESRIYVAWVKWRFILKPFVDQSSRHFETIEETLCGYQCTCPIMYVVFPSEDIGRLSLPLSCEVVEKGGFRPPICRERGYPRFWTCVFKSHSLPTMWPILVEFRSASSKDTWRKTKDPGKT